MKATVPYRTTNGLNVGGHWRKRAHRAKQERMLGKLVFAGQRKPALPCVVTFTQHSAGVRDDDGLTASFKHIRDGVADWLSINDADPRVTWLCRQEKCKRGEAWITIEITHE